MDGRAGARVHPGEAPTHVAVSTHDHADHTGGLTAAHAPGGVRLHATAVTRDLTTSRNTGAPADLLKDAILVDPAAGASLDLGGRRVWIAPHDGTHAQ